MEDPGTNETRDDQESKLISFLTDQMLESELTWNLFWSTCEHYKIDSLLRPFPKMYIKHSGDKMIEDLVIISYKISISNFCV